jgi:hypothetical protein
MRRNRIILTIWLFLCLTGGGLRAQELLQVTDEVSCDAAPTVFIGNTIRRVTVRTTHENKVRLVTTVAYEGVCHYTNDKWLEILELKVSGNAGSIHVKCGNMGRMGYNDSRALVPSPIPFSTSPARPHHIPDLPQRQTLNDLTPNGTVVFDPYGHWEYKRGNIRRDITVYVPVGAMLFIDSRYAEVILDSNIREVNARIMSGGLTMRDADRLVLTSAYGSIYAANIGHAEVALNHGWFHARDIPTLEIVSKVSTVELGDIGQLKINSSDDQYDLDEADVINGGKNYGSLRVVTLRNSLDLTGVNADVKVHNIEPGVSLVKIDGQYADLRLPVANLKDYTVQFEGTGSNIYTPFERRHATDSSFNVTVGTGKKSSFRLKCNNCTVDMK